MFKRDTEAARQARGKDSDLERRVRRDLAFLFDQYGATVSSNTHQAYGNSEIRKVPGIAVEPAHADREYGNSRGRQHQ
jgi:hypothetical protein